MNPALLPLEQGMAKHWTKFDTWVLVILAIGTGFLVGAIVMHELETPIPHHGYRCVKYRPVDATCVTYELIDQ